MKNSEFQAKIIFESSLTKYSKEFKPNIQKSI